MGNACAKRRLTPTVSSRTEWLGVVSALSVLEGPIEKVRFKKEMSKIVNQFRRRMRRYDEANHVFLEALMYPPDSRSQGSARFEAHEAQEGRFPEL
jgi:hypothetical protein